MTQSSGVFSFHRPNAGLGSLWVALALAACGNQAAGPGFTTTDSAGVTIVDNLTPSWTEAAAWQVTADPLLDLGGDEAGRAATEFDNVSGVILLPDGGVVTADGSSVVRAFNADGSVRWQAGRPGDGPGEFRLIASIGNGPADSIWVYDFSNRRFTILSADGTVVRTVAFNAQLSSPMGIARLADGEFVLRELWGSPPKTAPTTGMTRDPAAVVRLPADGGPVDTVAVYPGREVWVSVENGRGVMNTPLFSRNSEVAASGSRIVAGDQAAFAIDVFDAGSGRRRSIRLEGLDLMVRPAAVQSAINEAVEEVSAADQPGRRSFLEHVPVPDQQPAFGGILLALTGEIWVSEYVPPPRRPANWYVFDSDGRWLGRVAVPEQFVPADVSADRVAGVWRDELDVEHIRVYPLVRSGSR